MNKYLKYTLIFHLSFLIIRILYVIYRDIDLSTEEAQYWLWSKHLDLSYYSKPPVIAYLNFISTSILSDTEIAVRINAIIIGFLLAIITFFFTKYLFKDEKLAFFSSLFIYFIPAYDIASIIFLTDTPLALFWGLTTYFFYKAFNENKKRDWILTGIFAGLGFLSKYSMVLFLPGALIFIFIFKREIFKEKWFYISLFIAFLFTLPVIYWNIANDFVTFKHVGKLAGVEEKSFSLKHVGDYILGQIGINSVFLFPFFIFAIFKALKNWKNPTNFYLVINPLIIFFLFLIISLKKNVEPNWPAFGYYSLYILTASYIYNNIKQKLYYFLPLFLSGLSILILFYTPILDYIPPLNKLLPPEKDPTKRLVGWEKLGENIKNISKNKEKYFIFSDSYHISSELAFYTKDWKNVYCIRVDRRMNQFDLWEGISKYENKGYYGIYVADHPITDKVKNAFEDIEYSYIYSVKYRGKFVKDYYIYILKNFKHLEEDPITSY
ncbi:glycosyltransferase family 39 protein [Venenivibrio stagnispumantis]|uniref:Dolichyl-phosphate-mannose-protein mannosyltransferase n=1 Tax=Venenivibrio stagnispumantis TaxID=407998 RepID=A0AA45WPD0_9AQUI|nr:glycosyltransferase family 39 protein [Venenivibrio stagnispumantis]MCW4573378.1 glycosyltransferase family 39 protein [Venenivibrio stagnispumantis]SMP20858.1 Dolichyl-phosphate-mannose-protein mannosyltransferase [Venenivibrio stagnispumantis]